MATVTLSTQEHRAAILSAAERILPPVLWKGIIWQYIPLQAQEIDPSYSLFSPYLDLKDLIDSLPEDAIDLLTQIYEMAPRFLGQDQRFGIGHALDVETFAYTVQLVKQRPKDIVVCELACAHGEQGMLLAHAGAKKVILNESSPECISNLLDNVNCQPKHVSEMCEIDHGDCCFILRRKPHLRNKVDLLICRNLIHYFDNEKQVKFFETIHSLLKPGGQALCTASSVYFSDSLQEFEESPRCAFRRTACFVYNYSDQTRGLLPCGSFATTFSPDESEGVGNYRIYVKSVLTQSKWQAVNTQFHLLDSPLKKEIRANLIKHKTVLQAIPYGHIEVSSVPVKLYNRTNFKTLFEDRGFIPLEVFVVDKKGHLIPRTSNPFVEGQGVGILVLKP